MGLSKPSAAIDKTRASYVRVRIRVGTGLVQGNIFSRTGLVQGNIFSRMVGYSIISHNVCPLLVSTAISRR